MRDRDSILLENVYSLILEKDFRKIIIDKVKLPPDVAEYLHNFNDKYSLWFANQIKNMQGFKNSTDKVNWIRANLEDDMRGIIDWIRIQQNIVIKDYNWQDAIDAMHDFHNRMAEGEDTAIEGQELRKVIKKYGKGFYWVNLETNSGSTPAGEEERKLMNHCGTESRAETLFSLRHYDKATNQKEAFITIAVSPTKHVWYQAKGKGNSTPKNEYWPYIADILRDFDIFQFEGGGYMSSLDFDEPKFIQTVQENPKMFPHAEAIIKKLKTSFKARTNGAMFRKISSNFAEHENEFLAFDDEDRDGYIAGGFEIGTPRAYESLTPQQKERYLDKVSEDPMRSSKYVLSLIRNGTPIENVDDKFVTSISRNPNVLKSFLGELFNFGADMDFGSIPPKFITAIIGSPEDPSSGDPDLSCKYLIWLINHGERIDRINPQVLNVVARSTGKMFDVLKLLIRTGQDTTLEQMDNVPEIFTTMLDMARDTM
jgi:hypothetical protein